MGKRSVAPAPVTTEAQTARDVFAIGTTCEEIQGRLSGIARGLGGFTDEIGYAMNEEDRNRAHQLHRLLLDALEQELVELDLATARLYAIARGERLAEAA